MTSRKQLFSKLYILCHCGCNKLVKLINKRGIIKRYIFSHYFNTTKGKGGINHHNWKGGIRKDGKYWHLYMPEYFSSAKDGYVPEHIYNYEQYHKCCVLPWGEIHHIIPVTKDYCNNMIWNLKGMMKKDHVTLHKLGKHIDTSDRKCHNCGSGKTTIMKPHGNLKTPYPMWYHLPWDKINWYCQYCYSKQKKLKDI